MSKVLYIIILSTLGFGQASFLGLNTWTQSNVLGVSGGGYLIYPQNDFRNAAMLVHAKRHIQFDVIKYPAGISSQSMAGALQIKSHHFGFKVSRISYGIFEGRSVDNIKTEDYSAGDIQIQGGYGVKSNSGKFDFGFKGGILLSRLESYHANAITLSPSIIYHGKWVDLSFSAHNYGRALSHYGKSKEPMNGALIGSISRSMQSLPIQMEIDYIHADDFNNTIIFSGVYTLTNELNIRGGLSSNKSNLMTDVSFIKNVFSDFGFGIGYRAEDINLDMNIYSYGPSSMVVSMGIAIFY